MQELTEKTKKDQYCILFRENKGYYLSRIDIAASMNLNVVERGEKKYCLSRIEKLNIKLQT